MKNKNKRSEEMERKSYQKSSLIIDAWKRLKRNRLALFGMIILGVFIMIALFAPLIAPYDPLEINWGDEVEPPFWVTNNIDAGSSEVEISTKENENIVKVDESTTENDGEWSSGSEESTATKDNISQESDDANPGWSTRTSNGEDTDNNSSSWNTDSSSQENTDDSSGGWQSDSTGDSGQFGQSDESSTNMDQLTKSTKESKKPGNFYLLGTDQMGRDLFSRLIFGARLTLLVGFISVSISLLLGTTLGLLSGYFGGIVDTIIMRSMDILLSFPYILLAIFIVSILGRGLTNAMIAIGIVGTPRFARVVRSQVLSVKEKEYVMASRTLGAGNSWLITKHILVNSLSPLIVQTTMSLASAILYSAALGFLGLGAQAPIPEWGVMLSDARSALLTAPWIITFPGIAIILCVLGFNLLGDGLRDSLDPRQKR
jgi:peptide/nickel transport system permease protein